MKHTSPYLSPEQLGISTAERTALRRVATMLSTGVITEDALTLRIGIAASQVM